MSDTLRTTTKAALDARRVGTCEARFPGRCAWCSQPISKGETVIFTKKPSATLHCECACVASLSGAPASTATGATL